MFPFINITNSPLVLQVRPVYSLLVQNRESGDFFIFVKCATLLLTIRIIEFRKSGERTYH